MKLPVDVENIIFRLNAAHHRADVVGGPVRDFLLGNSPSDYDITTDATPDEVKSVFYDVRTVDTGIAHGTVSLIIGGERYEVTTYRVDGEYRDARHPESVSFTDKLSEDLRRRDFTMNAICYNPRDGITDLFGGREDIALGIIRAVGEPTKRFSEDALRILRGIRFASVLGFRIEERTSEAMREKRELLRLVSAERIYTEWKKLLLGKCAYSVISDYSDIIEVFLPEISTGALPDADRFSESDFLSRQLSLFALSLAENAPLGYADAMRRLKTDKAVREMGVSVLSSLGKYDLTSERGILFALMHLGEQCVRRLIRLEYLLGRLFESTEKLLDAVISSAAPYRLSDLRVSGADIMELGFAGREVGRVLSELLCEVVSGDVANEKDALLIKALKLKNNI